MENSHYFQFIFFLFLGIFLGKTMAENMTSIFDKDLETWDAPLVLRQNYRYFLSGFDDDNRPIWLVEFGRWDVRRAIDSGGLFMSDLDKYVSQWAWRMINSTSLKSTPEAPVTEFILILDMDGYSLSQLSSYSTISFLTRKSRELYRVLEKVETGFIINASFIARSLLNLLSPIFGSGMERIEIFGADRTTWGPRLLRRLPADQLPEQLGGLKEFMPVMVFGRR